MAAEKKIDEATRANIEKDVVCWRTEKIVMRIVLLEHLLPNRGRSMLSADHKLHDGLTNAWV